MRSRLLIEELSEADLLPCPESANEGPALKESDRPLLKPLISVLSSSDTVHIPTSDALYRVESDEGVPTIHNPNLPAPHPVGLAVARLPLTSGAVLNTEGALRMVPLPPERVYAPVGGAPDAATSPPQPEAQYCSVAAADALRLLAGSIAHLAPEQLDWGPDTAAALVQHSGHAAPALAGSGAKQSCGKLRPGLLIEELVEDQECTPLQPQRVSAVEIVLLCSLYGTDSRLDGAWVTAATADAAAAALTALAARLSLEDTCSGAGDAPEPALEAEGQLPSARVQALVGRLLPSVLQRLSAVLGRSKKRQNYSVALPTEGVVAVYSRALAARQLAWLVRQLGSHFLAASLPHALPAVLATLDDPSTFVESQGLWALHHVAVTAPVDYLRWQRALLLDAGKGAVSGADERCWPAAATAAVALVCAVEGDDPWAPGYDELVQVMLGEAELHMQQGRRSGPWLTAMAPLYPVLGLVTVRYFQRLMPLLLGWLHSLDAATQLNSLHALHSVIGHTWPRIRPHASLIRQHLAALHTRIEVPPEDVQAGDNLRQSQISQIGSPAAPGYAIDEKAEAIVRLLHWCGE